jgi:hypothetical protein
LTSNCEVQTQDKTLTICCNICLVIGSLESPVPLERWPNFQGPLFCHFDGKSLFSYQYTAVLKKTLALLGHETANYKSHSYGGILMFTNLYCITLPKLISFWGRQIHFNVFVKYLNIRMLNCVLCISVTNCKLSYPEETMEDQKTLALLGHETANYKSHSFRIGMATTLTLEGFTDDQIKAMGRWKSDCYIVRIPPINPRYDLGPYYKRFGIFNPQPIKQSS